VLFALKAARDAVNTRPETPGYLLFLGTGSHKSLVADMATRRSQPFAGAVSTAYEPLGSDFVSWKKAQLEQIDGIKLPSHELMYQGFLAVGQRPRNCRMHWCCFSRVRKIPMSLSPSSARRWHRQRQVDREHRVLGRIGRDHIRPRRPWKRIWRIRAFLCGRDQQLL
jgi:hypothetical protein